MYTNVTLLLTLIELVNYYLLLLPHNHYKSKIKQSKQCCFLSK